MSRSRKRREAKNKQEPFAYHQEIELDVSALTNLGHGLGRIDGWVVMVPFALPGEKVRARVWRNHDNYSSADLTEILEPSEHRIEAHCSLFGTCGGCQYQHLKYDQQLLAKQGQVEDVLARIAGIETKVEAPIASPQKFHYRSKLTPHFDRPREGQIQAIGFKHLSSRRVVDVPTCPIATDAINQALPPKREEVFENASQYRRGATLLFRDLGDQVVTDAKQMVHTEVCGVRIRFLAGDFFQNNPFILPTLVQYVGEEASRGGIRNLLDLYCGSGLFSLTLSKQFENVTGVEISESAVERAQENAKENHLHNCYFRAGSAESVFDGLKQDPSQTCAIIDPPRKGCDDSFLSQLFQYSPLRVVYVSCDPATQARDAKQFLEEGYRISKVQPFDLFPQTRHIENVITFERTP